jgi:hypothetical protein
MMDNDIPSNMIFRDPLRILLAREAKTCKGCTHQYRDRIFNQDIVVCTKTDVNGKRRHHGRRCKDYNEV